MKKFVIACAGFALLLASPIFAADAADAAMVAAAVKAVHSLPTTTTAIAKAIPGTQLSVSASNTTVPNFVGNFILVGEDETPNGLPCFFCAPAPNGGFGVSLTIPLGLVPTTTTTLDYSYMFQDAHVNGTCSLAFVVMSGTTVVDGASFLAGIYPSTWVVTFPRTRPTFSGNATIMGLVQCNGSTQMVVTSKVIYQ